MNISPVKLTLQKESKACVEGRDDEVDVILIKTYQIKYLTLVASLIMLASLSLAANLPRIADDFTLQRKEMFSRSAV